MLSKVIFSSFLFSFALLGSYNTARCQLSTDTHIAVYINQLTSEEPLFEEYEEDGKHKYEFNQKVHYGDNIYLTPTTAVISEDVSGTSYLGEYFTYYILVATQPYPTILIGNYSSGEGRMNLEEYTEDEQDKTEEDHFIENISYTNNSNQLSYPFQLKDDFQFSLQIFQLKNKEWKTLASKDYWTKELEQEFSAYFPLCNMQIQEKHTAFTIDMPSQSSLSAYFQYYKNIFGDLSQHQHKVKLSYDNQQLTLQYSPENKLGLGWKDNKLALLSTPKQKAPSTKTKNHCFDTEKISKLIFTGTIGDNSISMKLSIDPKNLNNITGEYWYGNNKKTMSLVGSCHNAPFGEIRLTRKKDGKTREYFYGNFDTKGNIKGAWGHIKKDKTLSFKLNLQ